MNTIRLVLVWLAGLSLALAQQPPIVVGAVISQTGANASLAADYARGLRLWHEQVNATGGLLGRAVDLRLLDDASSAARAAALYERLIREDKADLLIGPYGSAATLLAASQAERAGRVMVNGAGPAAAVHGRAQRFIFQSAMPYSSYAAGVLELAAGMGYRRLLVLARDDLASQEMAEAVRNQAPRDFSVTLMVHRPGNDDFSTQVARARELEVDAWIAFGEVRDAANMVKSFRKLDYDPRLFYARAATQPGMIESLGQDAEFSMGALEYDPRLGEAARVFAQVYTAKWSIPPTLPAAQGHAAGSVLAAAVLKAGTLDQGKLRAALAALETPTALGMYKVSPQNGGQIGARPAIAQIRRGRPEVVWPPAARTEKPVLPFPPFESRTLFR